MPIGSSSFLADEGGPEDKPDQRDEGTRFGDRRLRLESVSTGRDHPRKLMNNPDSSTMFAHIVNRLTDRTEDVAVEALGFILLPVRCGQTGTKGFAEAGRFGCRRID